MRHFKRINDRFMNTIIKESIKRILNEDIDNPIGAIDFKLNKLNLSLQDIHSCLQYKNYAAVKKILRYVKYVLLRDIEDLPDENEGYTNFSNNGNGEGDGQL